MDYARKIGKNDTPFPWKKRPSPPSSISDKPLVDDDEIIEDKRLKNWRKWLADRKRHCQRYGTRIERDYENLLINTSDKFLQRVETKNLVDRVGGALAKKVDKYRGDPGFWLTPEFLPKHGNPNLPDISITLTEKQRNFAPKIDRIAVPRLIQEEKGLVFRNDQKSVLKRREYPKTLTSLSTRETALLEAEEREVDSLFIKGQRFGQTKPEIPNIPIVTIAAAESFESPTEFISKSEDFVALKIQDRLVKFGQKDYGENFDHFALVFKSSDSRAVEGKIRLENLGTSTITYRWRYGCLGSSLIPSTPRSSPFFFNKNKDLLLPGQIIVLRVWFRSRIPCSVTEFWTLVTDPKVCLAPLIFRFWGCCSPVTSSVEDDENLGLDVERSIERYLDRRIRDTAINEIINEILDNVRAKKFSMPAYKSLFVESEIFRAKNPTYFYHPRSIRELRDIYNEATSEDSPDWSLSLIDLREILLRLNKPQARNEALHRFNELCRDSLVPSFHNPDKNFKKSMVHNSLCSFVNEFESEFECVRTKCSRESNRSGKRKGSQDDAATSESVSRTSQTNLMPRRRSKKNSRAGKSTISRTTSRTSVLSQSSSKSPDPSALLKSPERKASECLLYKEILYVRIREMLVDTINDICGIVDTVDNLTDDEKLITNYR